MSRFLGTGHAHQQDDGGSRGFSVGSNRPSRRSRASQADPGLHCNRAGRIASAECFEERDNLPTLLVRQARPRRHSCRQVAVLEEPDELAGCSILNRRVQIGSPVRTLCIRTVTFRAMTPEKFLARSNSIGLPLVRILPRARRWGRQPRELRTFAFPSAEGSGAEESDRRQNQCTGPLFHRNHPRTR